MAPMADSIYFPPLERCLKCEHLLLGWQDVYSALCTTESARSPGIEKFFADPTTQSILKKPLEPFEPSSAATKSRFETLTAAINVTPDEDGPYNIKQMKDDALWLAAQTKEDEVAALRVVVLEWQKRSRMRLLSRPFNAETSTETEMGEINFEDSIFAPKTSLARGAQNADDSSTTAFESTQQRRFRLLSLYLSEKLHVLKTSELQVRLYAYAENADVDGRYEAYKGDEVGKILFDLFCAKKDGSESIVKGVNALRKSLARTEPGKAMPTIEDMQPFVEGSWIESHLLQSINILQFIFTVSDFSSEIPSAKAVLSFFELMEEFNFFGAVPELPIPNAAVLQSILQTVAQLASLAVLKLDKTLEPIDRRVTGESDVEYPALDAAQQSTDYIHTPSCIRRVHSIFRDMSDRVAQPAASAMFAWSCIFAALMQAAAPQRRGSTDSEASTTWPSQQGRTDELFQAVQLIQEDSATSDPGEPFMFLASCAVDRFQLFDQVTVLTSRLKFAFGSGVNDSFDIRCRQMLLSLLRAGAPLVQYSPETLGALLAIIAGDRPYWDRVDQDPSFFDPVAQSFVADPGLLVDRFLSESISRYPAEALPYYSLVRTMILNGKLDGQGVAKILEDHVDTAHYFTQRLPSTFTGYREWEGPESENEEGYLPQCLIKDLPFFVSRRAGFSTPQRAIGWRNSDTANQSRISEYCVPAGTMGMVADDSIKPVVISWSHTYSPLNYMVGCLYTVLAGNDWVDASTGSEVPLEEVGEILNLLSTLILALQRAQSSSRVDGSQSAVALVLDKAFVDADPKKNLLAIVAEIFENQLQQQQAKPGDESSLEVLVRCIQFFHAVAVSIPNRLWPILVRSKLLEIDGNGGSLVTIVTAVEMITGKYDFLIGCVHLYEALVEASFQPGGVRPEKPTKALSRLNSRTGSQANGDLLPQRIASIVMISFSKTLISVFGNSRSWRYSSILDQSEISTRIAMVFNRSLHYTFGFDDEPDLHKKLLTSILADSAIYITHVLLSTTPTNTLSNSLIDMLSTGLAALSPQQSQEMEEWAIPQTKSSLALCTTALRVGAAMDVPTSSLEQHLFKAAPILARLYVAHEAFKSPVSELLEAMVTSASRSQSEPPSLLGFMGSSTARDFLTVLAHLDRPLSSPDTEINIWSMLASVVSSRQQWFAISLLTGNAPKERQKKSKPGESSKPRGRPLLAHALDQLCDISALEPKLALAMLKFVARCQNHWAWAVGELRRHPTFIKGITGYIRGLKREREDNPLTVCIETALAASVAETLAMYLHSCRQVGDTEAVKSIVPHLQYFKKYGVAGPQYNSSLHDNLRMHLERFFPGLQPARFKHTLVFPTEFGTNFFYDLPFASKVLDMRRSTKSKELQSSEQELRLANVNLSLVEAQITLVKQWRLLATELSRVVMQDNELPSMLMGMVKACLVENAESTLPQAIFDRIRHTRLDLATILLQKLVVLDIRDKDQEQTLRNIFSVAWETIHQAVPDFDVAFSGNDVDYYRALLQILFLTLQPLRKPSQSKTNLQRQEPQAHPPKESMTLLEVILHVVIKGFQSLANIIHEDTTGGIEPSDFVLLTAILQTILQIPGIELLYSQIALHFANNNVSGYATSLFSWADQLLIEGDPIYGELAILFLLEMSSIPSIAETMAVDGVLSQLTSAKLMQLYARARGMGPFDSPIRLHSIWTRGILPLCLNLLDAVGAPVAAEVVSFLNRFPHQLQRLATELGNRTGAIGTRPSDAHLTLSMASEAHSLSLIWLVIERYRAAGAGTGTLMQDIPLLSWDKASVKDDVEDLVQGRSSLGPLVLPANEREAELARMKPLTPGSKAGSRLEERIYIELKAASDCLKADGI